MSLMTRRSAALSLASLSLPAWAQAVQLRIGTVVPKNSTHHQLLLELGEGWRAAQGAGAKVVVFTDALPKTPVGKILRRELRGT